MDVSLEKLPYRPCVGAALVNERGLLFAGKRIDSDWNAWQMPQGGIEEGEKPCEAAIRELQEETGVAPELAEEIARTEGWLNYDLPRDLVPQLWGGRYRGQKQIWFLFRFLGRDSDINVRTNVPEFSEWGWFATDELLGHIVPFKKSIYRSVFEAFSEHLARHG
ncbi:MAG: RNA pyrophosphohydrolase [Albidovulum sp.]|nr:RNA pyrophosphohydrolase [Albidovulum sp.]MDE0303534.1 RNA pyrophosphohydrolase [Albidovulum sp.]MDE0531764.1 RNA pyrophosphohydrolase [Albidovulum sp.]